MPHAPRSLRDALALAGWSPRDLAAAINKSLARSTRGRDRVNGTTPYHWLEGSFPHDPYHAVAAADALAKRLGVHISVEQLWPGRGAVLDVTVAHEKLIGSWDLDQSLQDLRHLTLAGEAARWGIQASHGIELVVAAHDGFTCHPADRVGHHSGETVPPGLVEAISSHIAALRRLDDRQGGGSLSLRYVRTELRGVVELLKCGDFRPDVGRKLTQAAADLAQLAGWMHFDAGEEGAAQRYLLLGIRLARAAGDDDSAANMMGMIAYLTAQSGSPAIAVRLADSAVALTKSSSPRVRARMVGRLATAHAAAGDLDGYRRAADEAHALLERSEGTPAPPWLYYLNADQLAAESGQASVDLAVRLQPHQRKLLDEAVFLLRPLSASPVPGDYQRSALLHGYYLAKAHILRRELEQAVAVTRHALTRLSHVESGRCWALLTELRRDMAARKRNQWVADVIPEMDEALSMA